MTVDPGDIDLGGGLDGVEVSEGFSILPVGVYVGYIKTAEKTESKGGNPMLKIVVKLLGNPNGQGDGREFFYYIVLGAEYTLEKIKKLMMAVGLSTTGVKSLKPASLEQAACAVKLKHERSAEYGERDAIHYFVDLDDEERERVYTKLGAAALPAGAEDFPF